MKFLYLDESGTPSGDAQKKGVFVMCGVMVDAYLLRKKTAEFDSLISGILSEHPSVASEFKSSRFIKGLGGWSKVSSDRRKDFVRSVCKLAIAKGNKIFGYCLSLDEFERTHKSGHALPFSKNYWLASAMYIMCLVQKKMQKYSNNKGHTVVIMDDNRRDMSKFSDELYSCPTWYDGLYLAKKTSGNKEWIGRKNSNRFDCIINTAFAIKSNHSSLVQVADLVSYVYRRHIELKDESEKWQGEAQFFAELSSILDDKREKLGLCPTKPCVEFYRKVTHQDWKQ